MYRLYRATFVAVGVVLATSLPVLAQTRTGSTELSSPRSISGSAIVQSDAPIFLLPESGREPLRVAKAGSSLRLLSQSGEWCNVQFQDPQFGLRTGYIQTRFVAVQAPQQEAVDVSIPIDSNDNRVAQSVQSQRVARPAGTPTQQVREGFWFNAGLGYGTLGCDACLGRADGLSGGLVFGGKLSDKWLLGVGTTGWAKNDRYGDTLTVGTLDARFRFYPSLTSGFFLTGGLGVGTISVGSDSEIGPGVVLGLGWDLRIGRNVSLTPFWNGFSVRTTYDDANVGQIGLGVTFH